MNTKIHMAGPFDDLRSQLHGDCGKCCGLCCTALYFARSEGFPEDKKAGIPCGNLAHDFRCKIHSQLQEKNLKGCMAYDCFGAGQKVTQVIYEGAVWKHMPPEQAAQMMEVFLRVWRIHQTLWYLIEALALTEAREMKNELKGLLIKLQTISGSSIEDILAFDLPRYGGRAGETLKQVCRCVSQAAGRKDEAGEQEKELLGRKFQGKEARGRDFSMALMMAADLRGCDLQGTTFLGTDLRDADLRDADLSDSVFLCQMQLNEARGNKNTKLPKWLKQPDHWE